jgi:hypothetical protein
MKQVMGILDGHGAHTIDKHYALRKPRADVVLAKCLVESVIGQIATWPTEYEFEAHCKSHYLCIW